jgi:hypothetical protein
VSAAAPLPDGERRRGTTITLSREDDALLTALSAALGTSRSMAISHLISVHAGRETSRAQQQEAKPYPVVRWAKPKLEGERGHELIGYIAGLVRAGAQVKVAASMAGVSARQLGEWQRRGRRDITNGDESIFADFVKNLESAEAEVQVEDIQRIRRAGGVDWRALAFVLQRQYPDLYGERKRIDRTSQVNLVPVIDWERLTIAENRTLVELLRKASPELDDPRLTKTARPALELLPPDMVEALSQPDEEAPPLESIDGELVDEAPPLEGEDEKPQP